MVKKVPAPREKCPAHPWYTGRFYPKAGTEDKRCICTRLYDDHPARKPAERKGPAARAVHVINSQSSRADVAAARADLDSFFQDVLDKHHGGG